MQPTHLSTLPAVDLITGPGFSMMRKQEPSVRTVILVMINLPVGSGMVLQIGMKRRNLRHLLLLRVCVTGFPITCLLVLTIAVVVTLLFSE